MGNRNFDIAVLKCRIAYICQREHNSTPMDAATLESDGPFQAGRGLRGQYVYWIIMPMLKPETVVTHGIKTPAEYTRTTVPLCTSFL